MYVILKRFICVAPKSVNKADGGDKWWSLKSEYLISVLVIGDSHWCGTKSFAKCQSCFGFEKPLGRKAPQLSNSVYSTLVIYFLRLQNQLSKPDTAAVVALGTLCNCWHGLNFGPPHINFGSTHIIHPIATGECWGHPWYLDLRADLFFIIVWFYADRFSYVLIF